MIGIIPVTRILVIIRRRAGQSGLRPPGSITNANEVGQWLDPDLAVAHGTGRGGTSNRFDRAGDRRVGESKLEPHLFPERLFHPAAAVMAHQGWLATLSPDPRHGQMTNAGLTERCQDASEALGPDHGSDELHRVAVILRGVAPGS
jgi:hypothetical protein